MCICVVSVVVVVRRHHRLSSVVVVVVVYTSSYSAVTATASLRHVHVLHDDDVAVVELSGPLLLLWMIVLPALLTVLW